MNVNDKEAWDAYVDDALSWDASDPAQLAWAKHMNRTVWQPEILRQARQVAELVEMGGLPGDVVQALRAALAVDTARARQEVAMGYGDDD